MITSQLFVVIIVFLVVMGVLFSSTISSISTSLMKQKSVTRGKIVNITDDRKHRSSDEDSVTYQSRLTMIDDRKPGHMILDIIEDNPVFPDAITPLLYPTGVYSSDNTVLSIPLTIITVNGMAYSCSSTLIRTDDASPIQLQILQTDVPSALLSVPGPWEIRTNFVTKYSPKTIHSGIFDPDDDMAPYAAWRIQ